MNSKPFLFAFAALLVLTSFAQAFDISSGKGSTAYGYYYATGTPAKAWDSDNSTASEWITNSGASYDSNNTVDLNGTYTYSVTNAIWRGYDGTAGLGFSKLYIYYSNDNSTWTLAQAITGNTLGQRQFNFTAVQARYWRLTARDQYGDGAYGYTSYAGIYGTIYVSGDLLTIANPTNTTIVNSSVTLTYNFSSVVSSNATCYRVIDGTSTLLGTVASNASNSYELTGLSIGSHNATVTCQPYTGANVSTSTLFTRLDWLVNGNEYTTPVYETTNQTFTGSINTTSNVAILSATLFYNSTNQGVNTSVTQTAYQSNTTRDVTLPLLQVNNTNATLYWSYNLSWTNGTTIVVNTTSQTQAIIYGYYPTVFQAQPTTLIEGGDVQTNATIFTPTGGQGTVNVTFYLNTTTGAGVLQGTNYTANITTPTTTSITLAYTAYAMMNVTFNGASRNATSANSTVTVYQLNLTDCSASTNYVANFTFKDEEALTTVNGTMAITATLRNFEGTISRDFNFSFTNVTTASLCAPILGTFYLDTNQNYYSNYATTYPQRSYFLANASANTTTPYAISLYLLANTRATLTQFHVRDASTTPQENVTVQISRYYPSLNQYLLVAMTKTGAEGIGSTYLRSNDAQFRYYAYDYATLLNSYSPQQVVCDPYATRCDVTLTLTSDPLESYYSKTLEVTQPTPCVITQSTGDTILSCPYTAPSGALSGITLTVQRQAIWNATFQVCQTTNDAASGSLICNLGTNASVAGNYYTWVITVSHSPPQPLNNGVIDFTVGSTTFGSTQIGIFGMIVLYVTLVGVSLYTMSGSIVMAMVALFIGSGLGFFTLSYLGFIFLAIASSILIWKLRQ